MAQSTVTMLEFRKRAGAILERVRQGQSVVLTYRGEPAVRLEPIRSERPNASDAFYRLSELGAGGTLEESPNNDEIDRLVYGI
jgi:prevent-host-death family protein